MVVSLPSKRIFLLIIACMIGVGAIGFAVYSRQTLSKNLTIDDSVYGANNQNKTAEIVAQALKKNSEVDSDTDGLYDWEESLWGTDPKNPDSDNDQTKDGEEVRENRNPTKAGPNDKLLTSVSAGANGTVGQENITLETTGTAKISRELFANYMEAKKSGIPINIDTQTQIVNQTFSNESLGISFKEYSAADIKTNTSSDFKKYGNDLGLAMLAGSNPTENYVSEIEILHTALTKEMPAEIVKLDPIIIRYNLILNQINSISVPQELVGYHVELLNSVSRILTDVKGFRVMFEDPILGLAGVSSYYQDVEAMKVSLGRIRSLLQSKGISFEQGEYGYVFTQTI